MVLFCIIPNITFFRPHPHLRISASPSHLLQHLQGLAPAALAATHGTAVGHEVRNWQRTGRRRWSRSGVPEKRWEHHEKMWKKMEQIWRDAVFGPHFRYLWELGLKPIIEMAKEDHANDNQPGKFWSVKCSEITMVNTLWLFNIAMGNDPWKKIVYRS